MYPHSSKRAAIVSHNVSALSSEQHHGSNSILHGHHSQSHQHLPHIAGAGAGIGEFLHIETVFWGFCCAVGLHAAAYLCCIVGVAVLV
jgi:hypothetical protein